MIEIDRNLQAGVAHGLDFGYRSQTFAQNHESLTDIVFFIVESHCWSNTKFLAAFKECLAHTICAKVYRQPRSALIRSSVTSQNGWMVKFLKSAKIKSRSIWCLIARILRNSKEINNSTAHDRSCYIFRKEFFRWSRKPCFDGIYRNSLSLKLLRVREQMDKWMCKYVLHLMYIEILGIERYSVNA